MSRNGNSRQRMLHRITVLGDGGVGKTALTVQFTMSSFVESYDPTIEDCYRKQWVVDDQPCYLEVLDTAGQEEYTALRNQWIKDGEGFILVYAIPSAQSFRNLEAIFRRVIHTKEQLGEQRPPIVIVGNKSDKTYDRQVSTQDGAQLAQQLGATGFFEVSARTNQNVEAAFRTLVRAMSEQKNGYTSSQNAPGAGLGLANGGAPPRKKKRGGKCVIL